MQGDEGSQLEKALLAQHGRAGMEAVVPNPKLKLLDQVREVLRLRHYSIRTEQSYCDWIRPPCYTSCQPSRQAIPVLFRPKPLINP